MNRLCTCAMFVAVCGAAAQTPEQCDEEQSRLLRVQSSQAIAARNYDVAVQKVKQALAVCASDRQLLLDLAQAQVAHRDFADAVNSAQEYLRTDPSSAAGRIMLANAYLMGGRLKEALAEATVVLRSDRGSIGALEIKGNASYLLGNFSDAKDAFIALMERHPSNEEAPYMLGRMYYQEGYIDLAVGQFERVLKLNPRSYKALDNLGLCYQARGDNDKAVRCFLSSIRLVQTDHPEYDWPYANLADLLLKTGDNQKAYDAAAKAADRNPRSARNFYLGGKALCNLGKTELCMNWLQRSNAIDPNYPEPLYLLARVYHQLGQEEKSAEARKKFFEAQAKQPGRRR